MWYFKSTDTNWNEWQCCHVYSTNTVIAWPYTHAAWREHWIAPMNCTNEMVIHCCISKKKNLYTGVVILELPDLLTIFQRVPSDHPAIAKISQWTVNDRPVISTVIQNNLSMITKGSDLSTNAQWMLRECSRSTQWSHQFPNDLSVIFQWTQSFPTPKARWLRDQQAHKDFPQK